MPKTEELWTQATQSYEESRPSHVPRIRHGRGLRLSTTPRAPTGGRVINGLINVVLLLVMLGIGAMVVMTLLGIDPRGVLAPQASAPAPTAAELAAARAVVAAARSSLARETSLLPIDKADTDAIGAIVAALAAYDRVVKGWQDDA